MARYHYNYKRDNSLDLDEIKDRILSNNEIDSIKLDKDQNSFTIESELPAVDIEALLENEGIKLENHYNSFKINASIDCAECADKIECHLKSQKEVASASFRYPQSTLFVSTSLSEDRIKELAKESDSEVIFPKKEKKYTFNVKIDCAECAHKVEKALKDNKMVSYAHFSFPKRRLSVITTLSESEIKDICKKVEDDIEFLDKKEGVEEEKDYTLYRIIASLILFAIGEISSIWAISIISYLIAGYDVLIKAIKNIIKGKVFDENFLMAIATIGALAISSYEEAAGVMIFYQIGEYFQRKAVGKSRRSIASLMDLTSDVCTVLRDGKEKEERSENIKPGERIIIKAGEKISLDGVVVEGKSFLDTKALTGESVPVSASVGSKVLSGSINGDGRLIIEVTEYYKDSTASKIIRLVNESEGKKAKSEKFITRFSRYYTPIVCISALLLAFVPPIFGIMTISDSLYRACVLLVISCPCALVLSVPLSYFASIGSFARNGILVKGDEAIHSLSKMDTLAMDKTGTLTEGVFEVQKIIIYQSTESHILSVASALERNSTHPIATAILARSKDNSSTASSIKEIPGIGIEGIVDGKDVKAGSGRIISNAPDVDDDGTLVYVSEDNTLLGIIVISDRIKNSSKKAISRLRGLGVKKIWMLSGDRKNRAESIASELGLDGAYGELLPSDKITALETIMKDGTITGYAGDGINDAPTLKRADVAIAMGDVGSDAAIEASDIVIMNDDPEKIAIAMEIAKKTEGIVKQNIIGSLAVKALIFILAIFGLANMWLGVFADTGVALIAVINAMRAIRYKSRS